MARLFNGGTQPLVVEWGAGVVMPGEWIETDHPETYAPPWVQDPEASAAVSAREAAGGDETPNTTPSPDSPPEGLSGAENAPEPLAGEGPELHTLDNGDVVNQAGQVVGHIDNGGNA